MARLWSVYAMKVIYTALIIIVGLSIYSCDDSRYLGQYFYADSTLAFKLGGDRQQKSISLEPGTSLSWSLEYKSYEEDLSQYPHFRVSQLRAYQEHQDD